MPAYKSLHLKSTRRQLDLVSIHLAYLRAAHTRTQTQHKLRLATSNNASSFATGSKSLRQYAASNAERTNRPSEKPSAPNLHTAASGEATRPPAHMLHCTPTCEVGNAAIRKFHYYRAYTLMKHVKCQCSCMWHFQRINTHAYAYVCMCVCVVCMYIEPSWAASFIANVCNECKLVKSFHVARVSHVERKRS